MTDAREHSSFDKVVNFRGQKKTTPFGVVFFVGQ
jgi:hypothetical protein